MPINLGPWEMIVMERVRQQTKEGYSLEFDDMHGEGELALLAAAYALSSRAQTTDDALNYIRGELVYMYGWEFKPKDQIRDLVRAGALILAELERVMRIEEKRRAYESQTP